MSKKKYKEPRNTGQKSLKKFHGFGYYIHSNDKLTKKERKDFYNRSKIYLSEISNSLSYDIETKIKIGLVEEMDSNLSDIELKDIWNEIYNEYGYLIGDFKDKWEGEQLKGYKEPFNQHEEFEELKTRVGQLEGEIMKLKLLLIKNKGWGLN